MEGTKKGDFVSLDPTNGPIREDDQRSVALGLPTLDGATVGLLSNGKSNGMELLDAVYEELSREYEVANSISFTKRSVSVPPDKNDFTKLVNGATVVVTAIGD